MSDSVSGVDERVETVREALMASLSLTGDVYPHDQYDDALAALDSLAAAVAGLEQRGSEAERKIAAYDAARAQVKREGHSRAEYVLRAELAEQRADDAEKALRRIDFVLTTAYGDNIPRGELPKSHARAIARTALAAAVVSAEPTEETAS